jgi:hypothetical protein
MAGVAGKRGFAQHVDVSLACRKKNHLISEKEKYHRH